MNDLIKKVFNHQSLIEKPPVLVDVGASGAIHEVWKKIAKYSICIAFDADTRDFEMMESNNEGYKKLIRVNRIVAEVESDSMNFYLTKSPYCSSALEPNSKGLEKWRFRNLFELVDVAHLPSVTIDSILHSCSINYLDWFKTDSQGTDLRLFKSISDEIRKSVLIAEFEPGIVDAYNNEDKLFDVMHYMNNYPYWVSRMILKGSQRINERDLQILPYLVKRYLQYFLKTPPGWCEITYLKNVEEISTVRDLLLAWVISTLQGESGNALEIANLGYQKHGDIIFLELKKHSFKAIKSPKGYLGVFNHILKRLFPLR